MLDGKLKSNKLVSSIEGISRQHSIESVSWLIGLFLIQVFNEREHVGQNEIQNVQFGQQRNIMKANIT